MSKSVNSITGRFALFGGDAYYASGGFVDFIGSFPTLEEAKSTATRPISSKKHGDHMKYADGRVLEWWHIFDFETREVVAQSEWQAYGWEKGEPIIRGN